jgi:hypothetical protein
MSKKGGDEEGGTLRVAREGLSAAEFELALRRKSLSFRGHSPRKKIERSRNEKAKIAGRDAESGTLFQCSTGLSDRPAAGEIRTRDD